jgi:hypothetical protein
MRSVTLVINVTMFEIFCNISQQVLPYEGSCLESVVQKPEKSAFTAQSRLLNNHNKRL